MAAAVPVRRSAVPVPLAVTGVVNDAPVVSVSALVRSAGTAAQASCLSPVVSDSARVTDSCPLPEKALPAKTSGAQAPGVTSTVWSSALPAPVLLVVGCSDSASVMAT